MLNKFLTIIREYELKLNKENVLFNVIGYLKLFLVLLMGFLIYWVFTHEFPLIMMILVGVVLITLTIFWVYHNKLQDSINYAKGIISICNRTMDRITGQWTSFDDVGAEYVEAEHAYACDLDIVGTKSLFQLLNTTNTWHGRQAFAIDLLQASYSYDEIKRRQEAIRELSKDIGFSNHIQYHLSKIGVHNSTPELVFELKNKQPFEKNKVIKAFLTFLPLLTVVFMAGTMIFQLTHLYLLGAMMVLLQAVLWIVGLLKTRQYLGVIAHLPYKLGDYEKGLEILKSRDFDSEKLVQIQEQISRATHAIKDLGKISDKASMGHNGIIYIILNVLLLWDYSCAFMLAEWKEQYADLVEGWFLSLGEFESLLCFSQLANICSETCMPSIAEAKKTINAKSMGHPLLTDDIRVSNDISCNDKIFIVSGSNMSGKTTFLRTVGINLVLASAGGFVCAKQLTFSLTRMMTSMRIADDLNEGVSTFYAELKRIKDIIGVAKEERDLIFLIDEIFRGTNSVDRLFGAKTVIAKLNELGAIGMVSTHDMELCELANHFPRIMNYSFSEHYRNNAILFDYKIKSGQSETTNAKYLMEMIGIL